MANKKVLKTTPRWISKLLKESKRDEIFLFDESDKEKETYVDDIVKKVSSYFHLKGLKLVVLNATNYLVYKVLDNGGFQRIKKIERLRDGKPSKIFHKLNYGVLNLLAFAYGYDAFKGLDFNSVERNNELFMLAEITIHDRNGKGDLSNIYYEFSHIHEHNLSLKLNSSHVNKTKYASHKNESYALKLDENDNKLNEKSKGIIKSINAYKKVGRTKFFVGDIVVGFPNKELSVADDDPDFYGLVSEVKITFFSDMYDQTMLYHVEYLISWNGLSIWLSESRLEAVGFNIENIDYDKFNYIMKKYNKSFEKEEWKPSHAIQEHPFRYGSFFDLSIEKDK